MFHAGFRREQPKCPVVLNRSHPLASRLIYSTYNSATDFRRPPVNYVDGSVGTLTGSTLLATGFRQGDFVPVSREAGLPLLCQTYNGTSDFAVGTINLSHTTYRRINVSFWHWLTSNASAKNIIVYGTGAALTNGFFFTNDVANNQWLASTYVSTTHSRYHFGTLTSATGFWRHFSLNFDMDATQEFVSAYIDGASSALTVLTQDQTAGSSFSNLGLGLMAASDGTSPAPGRLMRVDIFIGNLGAAEVNQLYRYPWAMFKPNTLPLYGLGSTTTFDAHRFELAA